MNRPNWKMILLFFIVILLMSRAGRIMDFFSNLDPHGILTLEPLRNSPEEGRFIVTVLLLALAFVVFWRLFIFKK
jgi:hypothetical protein